MDIRPAKIVYTTDVVEITPHGDYPAYGFINAAGRHVVSINGGVFRQQGLGKGKAFLRIKHRSDNGRIAVDVTVCTHQGFNHTGSLDFMIILAGNPFRRTNIGPAKKIFQQVGIILRGFKDRLTQTALLRRNPFGLKLPLGKTGLEQIKIHIGAGLAFVGDMKFT